MVQDSDAGDCDTSLVSTGSLDHLWTAIVRFLKQFGTLGQVELQEPLGMRRVEREGNVFFASGDHIGWFLDHAQHVRTCLALIAALNASEFSEERERGRKVLRYIEETRPRILSGPLLIPTLQKTLHQVDHTTLWKPGDLEDDKARVLLREFLVPNLGMVERGYDPKTGRTVFKFKVLLQLIYWQLADWIDGGRLRQCAECQTPFRAADGRQRFCPPPYGVNESRCARRARERARREKKQREGEATT
jgi:hypothetical protein